MRIYTVPARRCKNKYTEAGVVRGVYFFGRLYLERVLLWTLHISIGREGLAPPCLLYTSDAADE